MFVFRLNVDSEVLHHEAQQVKSGLGIWESSALIVNEAIDEPR